MLAWIGIALLSVSWLLGLGYYHPANWPAWSVAVVLGTFLLADWRGKLPPVRQSALAAVLILPPLVMAPWPYRAAMVLIFLGALARVLVPALAPPPAIRRANPAGNGTPLALLAGLLERVSFAATLSGCILLAQALGMMVYATFTSRSHELPTPLPRLLGLMAKAVGIESAVHENTVAMFSMRKTHLLGATWELFLDPVTWSFLVGGTVAIAWRLWSSGPRKEAGTSALWPRRLPVALAIFAGAVILWLPVRSGLYMGAYLHDVLRTKFEAPLESMRLFWSTWVHLLLMAGPVVLAWRLVPVGKGVGPQPASAPDARPWHLPLACLLVAGAAASLSAAVLWDPVGERKEGRVVIEEYHPPGDKQWERTDKPFDTEWYGKDSGYNYYCIYDYSTRFYKVLRHEDLLNRKVLANCDVLIVKIPTRSYSKREVEVIEEFVREGGGLMLIGEHTDVFGSGAYLNSITRQFGFTFRYDCLFSVEKVWEQRFEPPLVPHPILRAMPGLDFATSCSIDPGTSSGRAVIRSWGLKNKMADYHADNFYPQTDDVAEMRYGAFVQLWAMRYGRGRIAAFTDSTIFSNFSAFEPGKKELWMGMIEWLNHRSPWLDPRRPLGALGVVLLGAGVWLARRLEGSWLILVASGLVAWSGQAVTINAAHRAGMPDPPPWVEPARPIRMVTMDQSVSRPELPKGGFISGTEKPMGFGIFERWTLRLGYFTQRLDKDVLQGDLVVFALPEGKVSSELQRDLLRYVAAGGKVLVIDAPEAEAEAPAEPGPEPAASPESPDQEPPRPRVKSTANDLLAPFNLSIEQGTPLVGPLSAFEGWPTLPVFPLSSAKLPRSAVVTGGQPFAWVNDQPVGASVSYGNRGGSVTAVGFGWRFGNAQMGMTGDFDPYEEDVQKRVAEKTMEDLRSVYEWQFGMLKAIVEGRPLGVQRKPPMEVPPWRKKPAAKLEKPAGKPEKPLKP